MHDLEFDHEHEDLLSDDDRREIAQAIAEQDTLRLLTVGVDIGSSTSHILFARITMQRLKDDLSNRFVVTDRQVMWESPILLTPFKADGTIDAHELQHFLWHCYQDAGIKRDEVDSGAVILTGEAIKKTNARAIDEIFARESGRFVCATAGHNLESILAAYGSGAAALSRRRAQVGLHVDIGGGTTKLALVSGGEVLAVSAFAVGGRVIAKDDLGVWSRIDDTARLVAGDLGIEPTSDAMADGAVRQRIADRLADIVLDQISGTPPDQLGRTLLLTPPLERVTQPAFVSFSGGVSEYIFGSETHDFGDIAIPLAKAISARLSSRLSLPIVDAGQRIRATVIGASQFTVQVSGKTIHIGDPAMLPVRNVPVVHIGQLLSRDLDRNGLIEAINDAFAFQDVTPTAPLGLAFEWDRAADYHDVLYLARIIQEVTSPGGTREAPLILVTEGDVGQTLGRILERELGIGTQLICVDGIALRNLDFVDIGEIIDPPGVVPVVIKSLLFS